MDVSDMKVKCSHEYVKDICGICVNCAKSYDMEPCRSCKHGSAEDNCFFMEYKEEYEEPLTIKQNNGNAAGAVHYHGEVQPLEFMQAVLSPERFQGFLQGNVIKYAARIGKKDDSVKDAQKIRQYAHWLVMALEGKKIDPRKDVL